LQLKQTNPKNKARKPGGVRKEGGAGENIRGKENKKQI